MLTTLPHRIHLAIRFRCSHRCFTVSLLIPAEPVVINVSIVETQVVLHPTQGCPHGSSVSQAIVGQIKMGRFVQVTQILVLQLLSKYNNRLVKNGGDGIEFNS